MKDALDKTEHYKQFKKCLDEENAEKLASMIDKFNYAYSAFIKRIFLR